MDIRATIVAKRRARLENEGAALGCSIPEERSAPLQTFPAPPGIICEVKRRSPSRGDINSNIDPFAHIAKYVSEGARSVSILTEEDYFNGSLTDLIEAKRRFPELSVLRKDFLFDDADIDVSYRAGADSILLIASVLDRERLAGLYSKALEIGLTPLVEVHDFGDLDKIAPIKPKLVGCNARNLETFHVDLLVPIALRRAIDWDCTTVFESGIWVPDQARIARDAGFDSILVGESVVRDPLIVSGLISGFTSPPKNGTFWKRIVARKRPDKPLVKVCGLTREVDLNLAAELGADVLGFICADSPRRVTPDFIRSLPKTEQLKVAVVVANKSAQLDAGILDLFNSGYIDAVQFHGDESPLGCAATGIQHYKALQLRDEDDVGKVGEYYSPRVLVDSRGAGSRGGTGTRIDTQLVDSVRKAGPLWLAGGLNPENIRDVTKRFGPELVDVSSGVEAQPGIKDSARMKRFFDEIL